MHQKQTITDTTSICEDLRGHETHSHTLVHHSITYHVAAETQRGGRACGYEGASDHDISIDYREAGTETGRTSGAAAIGVAQITITDTWRAYIVGIDILSCRTAYGASAITIESVGPAAGSTLGIGGARACCAGGVTVITLLPVTVVSIVTVTGGLRSIV